jgi:antitoxin ParD1/3/4
MAMGEVRKISIALTEELAADIERAVASGDYASTSEVIRDALRGWKQHRAGRLAEIEGLRRLWTEGLSSGEPQPVNEDWFASIRTRGMERLAKARSAR